MNIVLASDIRHAETVPPTAQIDPALLRRQLGELPALPQAVMEVLAILRRENASAADCAERIARDQAMTVRTLRLANSAFYGMPGRVATIHDAVHMLGRRTLGALLTTAAVSAQFGRCRCPGFDFQAFWRHALGTAIAAQSLARELASDDDLAFTAGLLHDVGRLALATYFPAELGAALAKARADDAPLLVAERSVLGIDHTQVGAMIAARWHFPAAVAEAISAHHAPPAPAGPATHASLTDLVHVADAIAHALDLSGADDEMVPDIETSAWARLALSPMQCLRVFERTETGVAALCQALGVDS